MNRAARNEYMRKWNATNRERLSVRRKALYRERVASGVPMKRKTNAEVRAWRAKNPDKVRECHRRDRERKKRIWTVAQRAAEADRCRLRAHARRSASGPGVSPSEWRAIREVFCGRCAYCLGEATELDHIEPLSKGGEHSADNAVPACSRCNRRKSNKSLLRALATGVFAP